MEVTNVKLVLIKSSNKFYWMDNLFRAIDKQNKLTPGFKDGYLKTMREQVSKNRIKRELHEPTVNALAWSDV